MPKTIPDLCKKVQLPLMLSGIAIGAILLTSSKSVAAVLKMTDDNFDRLELESAGWKTLNSRFSYLPWDRCGEGKFCGKDLDAPHKRAFGGNFTRMADFQGYYWGQCVSFVKALSKNTYRTQEWRKGQNVAQAIKAGTITPGTAIATFRGREYWGHAAFYAGADISPEGKVNALWVYDQNWIRNKVLFHKTIRASGSGLTNLNNYFIVEVPKVWQAKKDTKGTQDVAEQGQD